MQIIVTLLSDRTHRDHLVHVYHLVHVVIFLFLGCCGRLNLSLSASSRDGISSNAAVARVCFPTDTETAACDQTDNKIRDLQTKHGADIAYARNVLCFLGREMSFFPPL